MSSISGASNVSYNWLPQGSANISSGSIDWLTAGSSSDPVVAAADAFAMIAQDAVASAGNLVAAKATTRLQAQAMAKLFNKVV